MTVEEFKGANRLEAFYQSRGFKLIGNGARRVSNRCAIQEHKAEHLCVTIDIVKQLWHCNDCEQGGDIISWMAIDENKTAGQILKSLGTDKPPTKWEPAAKKEPALKKETQPPIKSVIGKTYQYHNAAGDEVFQVVRMIPKDFRQRHKVGENWVWSMEGVERVLYHLPDIQKADTIAFAEGEKDADTLVSLGFCGTCNVGGAEKWLDGYTESLAGKNVLLFGDNDDKGRKHVQLVFESIAGKAKTVKLIKIPETFKDVTEYVESFTDPKEAIPAIQSLIDSAHPFYQGVAMPLYTMAEIEPRYKKYANNPETESLNLGKWLPSFNRMRKLMPGEVVLIVGDTGAGKTALLQSIALSAAPLPTLLFEIELPAELLFERFIAARTKFKSSEVEYNYSLGDEIGPDSLNTSFPNLFICDDATLTLDRMESMIIRSELKIGVRPKVVLLDYAQLLQSTGESRYDKASNVAESIKRIAKSTKTIIIMASQRSRPGKDSTVEVGLHDAKESGSLENSSGLVLGTWRDPQDKDLLHLRVLKSTKGGAGMEVLCNFDGERMRITERSNVSEDRAPVQQTRFPDQA